MGDSSSGIAWDRVDIATFVLTVEAVRERLEPLFSLWKFLAYVIRWESSVASLLTFCTLQVFCWWPEYMPLLFGMAFSALFLHGFYVQSLGGTLNLNSHQYLAAKRVEDDADDRVLGDHLAKEQAHSEQLAKYRSWLRTAQTVAEELVLFLDSVYSVVRWSNSKRSVSAYQSVFSLHTFSRWVLGGLFAATLVAFIPLHWTLTLILWLVLLCNVDFLKALQRQQRRIWWWRKTRRKCFSSGGVHTTSDADSGDEIVENMENGAVGRSSQQFAASETASTDFVSISDDEADCAEDDTSSTTSAPQRNTVVSRLKELRQRRKLNKQAQCARCGKSLSSILRKRHYCRRCGQDFCSNCCSEEVPRSSLGATAPVARFEKVRVCCDCLSSLNVRG